MWPYFTNQFLRGYNEQIFGKQFKKNDVKRNYNYGTKRTILRHTVINFHEKSEPYLTAQTLKTIVKAYIKQRCPKSLAMAVVHWDTKPHIHIVWSAVDISGNPTRINQQSFAEFKKGFQDWQEKTFPELHHSRVEHGKKKPFHFAFLNKKRE